MALLLVGSQHGAPCSAVLVPDGREYRLGDGDGSVLFQVDYDLEHLAKNLGWGGSCCCCEGPGQPDAEGLSAWDWLSAHDGETFAEGDDYMEA